MSQASCAVERPNANNLVPTRCLVSLVDVAGFTSFGSAFLSGDVWWACVRFMRQLQQRGKAYFSINEWGGPDGVNATVREFVVASYLAGKEQAASVYLSTVQGYGSLDWSPAQAAPVGDPVGEATPVFGGQVVMRNFTNGLSLACIGDASAPLTVPLDASKPWYSVTGEVRCGRALAVAPRVWRRSPRCLSRYSPHPLSPLPVKEGAAFCSTSLGAYGREAANHRKWSGLCHKVAHARENPAPEFCGVTRSRAHDTHITHTPATPACCTMNTAVAAATCTACLLLALLALLTAPGTVAAVASPCQSPQALEGCHKRALDTRALGDARLANQALPPPRLPNGPHQLRPPCAQRLQSGAHSAGGLVPASEDVDKRDMRATDARVHVSLARSLASGKWDELASIRDLHTALDTAARRAQRTVCKYHRNADAASGRGRPRSREQRLRGAGGIDQQCAPVDANVLLFLRVPKTGSSSLLARMQAKEGKGGRVLGGRGRGARFHTDGHHRWRRRPRQAVEDAGARLLQSMSQRPGRVVFGQHLMWADVASIGCVAWQPMTPCCWGGTCIIALTDALPTNALPTCATGVSTSSSQVEQSKCFDTQCRGV